MKQIQFMLILSILFFSSININPIGGDINTRSNSIMPAIVIETNATFTPSFELSDEDLDSENDTINILVEFTNPDFDLVEIKFLVFILEAEEWHPLYDEWSSASDSNLGERAFEYTVRWDANYRFEIWYFINDSFLDEHIIEVELDGFSKIHEWWYDINQFYNDPSDIGLSLNNETAPCSTGFELDVYIVYDDLDALLSASLEVRFINDTHNILLDEFKQSEMVNTSGKLLLSFNSYTPTDYNDLVLIVRVFQDDEQFGVEDIRWTGCDSEPVLDPTFSWQYDTVEKDLDGDGVSDSLKILVKGISHNAHESIVSVKIEFWRVSDAEDSLIDLVEFKLSFTGNEEHIEDWLVSAPSQGNYYFIISLESAHFDIDPSRAEFEWNNVDSYEQIELSISFLDTYTGEELTSITGIVEVSGHIEAVVVSFKIWNVSDHGEVLITEIERTVPVTDTGVRVTYEIDAPGIYLFEITVIRGLHVLKEAHEQWIVNKPVDTTPDEPFVHFENLNYELHDGDNDECSDTIIVSGSYKWESYSGPLNIEFYAAGIVEGQEFSEQLLLTVNVNIDGSGSDSFEETILLPISGSVKFYVRVTDENDNLIFEGSDRFENLCAFKGNDETPAPNNPLPLPTLPFYIVTLLSMVLIVRRKK